MYNYVFFDLDGTLTQSEFGIIDSIKYALSQLGIDEQNPESLKRFIGPPLWDAFKNFYELSDENAEKAVAFYRDYYSKGGLYNAPLYDGIYETVKTLYEAGKGLFVVTSKPTVFAKRIVDHFGLGEYFSGVIGPELSDKGYGKKELIEQAMEKCTDSGKCLMVGDRHFDIDGATEAGIDSVGVLYGYGTLEELKAAGATYIINHASELIDIVNQ